MGRVDYACKGSTVGDEELLAVEPSSEGRCGADIRFRTRRGDSSGKMNASSLTTRGRRPFPR